MKDATSHLRSATRRAKSDVANKLISMFLHEVSRRISSGWRIRVDGKEYEQLVRERFGNLCPYCSSPLNSATAVIEHLDGMNRQRAGLHVAGNVLVACRRCNNEKRRDDFSGSSPLASSGWESFLSHVGRCGTDCATCRYWSNVWPDASDKELRMRANLTRIRSFREEFPELRHAAAALADTLPRLLAKLYADCQLFAEQEIASLLEKFEASSRSVQR